MKRKFSASVRAVVEYALMGGDLSAAGSLRKLSIYNLKRL